MLNTNCAWPDDLHWKTASPFKEVHLLGYQDFPCPLIDNRNNIESLLLSGSFQDADYRFCDSALRTGEFDTSWLESSPVPPNFHQLTIRATAFVVNNDDLDRYILSKSYLPAAGEIIYSFSFLLLQFWDVSLPIPPCDRPVCTY
jgi:hypothetical protein